MQDPNHYDLIVIGGGSAGITATTMAARLGARVLLVDRESLGGDCLHYGCVPSKALIASARLAHRMRHSERYGLGSTDVKVDLGRVMARINRIRDEIGSYESPETFRRMGAEVAFGGARFVDDKVLDVGDTGRVTADRILIATGSHAITPTIPGLAKAGYIDHVGLFHLQQLPRRLAVIGGGPVGSEMAQALSRLGSRVTIIQRAPRLLPREDPELSEILKSVFEHEGIELLFNAVPVRVDTADGRTKIEIEQESRTRTIDCDQILVATGREPTIDALNLPAAGIQTNRRGIVVNDALETTQRHIFAVGDCNGGPQFTHWGEYEARVATRNALFRGGSKRSTDLIPWTTFTDPEVARVGMTMEEAGQAYGSHRVHEHSFPYSRLDRALCESEPEGMIKIVVNSKDQVLGAHIIGTQAGEALAEWVLAKEHRLTLSQIGSAIHVYPTFGRINRRVADEAFLSHGVSPWITNIFGRFRPKPSERSN